MLRRLTSPRAAATKPRSRWPEPDDQLLLYVRDSRVMAVRAVHSGAMPRLLLRLLLLAASSLAASGGATGVPDDARYDPGMCQASSLGCGDDADVDVHYPFFLANATAAIDGYTAAPSYCGYPGMGILCDGGRPALRLGDRNYTVLGISYGNYTVTLADGALLSGGGGGDCPRPAHNVTVPRDTWLNFSDAANDDLAFFYDCDFTRPNAPPRPPPEIVPPINCSGFRGREGAPSFVVPLVDVPAQVEWPRACKAVVVVPVLREQLLSPEYFPRLNGDGYGRVLRQGFQMSWDPSAGPCDACEKSKGQCSYNQTGGFLGCLCSDGRVRDTECGPKKSTKKAIAIGASIAAGVCFLLLVVMSYLYIRKRRQYKMTSSSRLLKYTVPGDTPRSKCAGDTESASVHDVQTHHFTYEELEEATEGFNGNREIGDGGFGTVYKGHLRDGRVVAVKRLYNNSCRRVEQFLNEAAILSRLRHPSLVMFYGCTSSRSRELLLVYEFVPNGTVADHLHGHRAAERALTWPLRLRVAVEAAAALTYLHAVEPPIVHRDVKTCNILLDASFHVKVADFGLSRLFPVDVTHVSTAPQGTPGYVDPEYHQCYQLTDKSDVYSFGVVLTELISSKPAVDVTRDRNEINLAGMAVNKIQRGELEQLVDVELGYGSDQATRETMTMVAELAFRCLQHNGEMRPPIREVLDVLRGIQEGRLGKKDEALLTPRSPNTVHAPWDSMSTTPSISQ